MFVFFQDCAFNNLNSDTALKVSFQGTMRAYGHAKRGFGVLVSLFSGAKKRQRQSPILMEYGQPVFVWLSCDLPSVRTRLQIVRVG